ncbi:phospholipase a2 [Fusarium longipes]|uniref:Lysophospholipase n=1 Tax=Fusarium longipes TaxID=694270 RepID=A0A395SXA9_9HYPO|nr:phospholipase a2 [Fusarium longipes]
MSGTAPNDPAPGGHSRTLEQTPLDSNQHGQAQNIIDETKETSGRIVDANIGESIDAANSKHGTSGHVDDIINQSGRGSGGSLGAQQKAAELDEKGFKVGKEADLYDLAQTLTLRCLFLQEQTNMVILTSIRKSPTYLYAKTYCLCALVSIVQATPVSSRFRTVNKTTPTRFRNGRVLTSRLGPYSIEHITSNEFNKSSLSERASHIVNRWYARFADLASVRTLLKRDGSDIATYPELKWDAKVRHGSSLHPEEQKFIELRKLAISSEGRNSLHHFLDLPLGEKVDARDVPLISLGGSGGGYRVMYGFTGFISAAKKSGLWDCITWTAGVSGSCWTIAAYYTIARHDISKLVDHYMTVASELAHPMSIYALDKVARSKRGLYFLIGPLVSKAQKSIIGLSVMDLYSTLTATYQLLSREPKGRLSRATFQWSKIWHRSGIDKGLEPMPILAAVRRVPRYSYEAKTISAKARAIQSNNAVQDLNPIRNRSAVISSSVSKSRPRKLFQYFEISPLEIGSPDLSRYVPTWSWGRTFVSGYSVDRRPEQSFSLLLGQCTSAPAGPLTECIKALLVSIPKNTIMARLVATLNEFLQSKRLEGLWGNPIRAGHDPNPFYGLEKPLQAGEHTSEHSIYRPRATESEIVSRRGFMTTTDSSTTTLPPWEAQGRTRLMDCGMANNLPNHVLARPERGIDVFISFDSSSDVQTGAAVQRLHHFASDFGFELQEETDLFHKPTRNADLASDAGVDVESRYINQYARVFRGERQTGQIIYIIYCPLLPNGVNPEFDPSTASFSTSTNLMWTPDQVQSVLATAEANMSNYALDTVQRVIRKVYEDKKARRQALETLN